MIIFIEIIIVNLDKTGIKLFYNNILKYLIFRINRYKFLFPIYQIYF